MEKVNIVVFGDSLAYGMGDYKLGGWVNRLRLMLDADGDYYYDVYNMGIPDDTTGDVLKRFTNELNPRFYQGKLILIFECGANDCAQAKLQLEKFRENVSGILYLANLRTDNIAFIGIPPVADGECEGRLGARAYFNDSTIKVYDKNIGEICATKGVRYIPIRGLFGPENTVDGCHPDPDGHEIICRQVYNYIKEVLNSTIPTKKDRCCLCGGPILTSYGNNPAPLSEMGRCCDTCNVTKVLPARLKGVNNDAR